MHVKFKLTEICICGGNKSPQYLQHQTLSKWQTGIPIGQSTRKKVQVMFGQIDQLD